MKRKQSTTVTPFDSIREYAKHAFRYKLLVFGTLITVPLAVLLSMFVPQLFAAQILDKISRQDFVQGDIWQSFGTPFMWYAVLSFVGGVVLWRVVIICIWLLEMRVQRDIYQRVFSHLLSQGIDFHNDRFGGSLVSQANKFASAYVRFTDTTFFDVYTLIISFIFSFIVIYTRAPWIAIILLVLSLSFIVIAIFATKAVRKLRIAAAASENKQTGFLADAITNIGAIKSYSGEPHENKRFAGVTEEVRQKTHRVMVASMQRETLFGVSTTTINVVALLGAIYGVVHYQADIATVFLVITYTGMVTERLWEFSQRTLREYNRAFGDAEEMTKILAIAPSVKDPAKPEMSKMSRGDITWRDVTFTHSNAERPIFDHFNLHIKPGEKIGLVGHSGSGKTTFTRLLMRFSDIQHGAIAIDNQDISKVAQGDLHRAVAYVPQEPMLFHRSIAENIGYGRPGASREEIEAVARMAHADTFIESLPDGYDTLVGERGVKLSGGQRQRVAIARTMIKNSPILLLDEATSALDSESEVLIQDALWKLMEGRTAIVIAHRLSTIQHMDRILVMEDGKIVEQGTHKELITQGGAYSKLWSHQSGGFLK